MEDMNDDSNEEQYNLTDLVKMVKEGNKNAPPTEEMEVMARRIVSENKEAHFIQGEVNGGYFIGVNKGDPKDKDPWNTMVDSLQGAEKTLEEWVAGYTMPTILTRGIHPEITYGIPKDYYTAFAEAATSAGLKNVMTRGKREGLTKLIIEAMSSKIGEGYDFTDITGPKTGLRFVNTMSKDDFTMGPGLIANGREVKAKFDDLFDDVMHLCLKQAIDFVNILRTARKRDIQTTWFVCQAVVGHSVQEEVPEPNEELFEFMTFATAATLASGLMTQWGTEVNMVHRMALAGVMGGIDMTLLTARRGKQRKLGTWEGEQKYWDWSRGCDLMLKKCYVGNSAWADKMVSTPYDERNKQFRMPSGLMRYMDSELVGQLLNLMTRRYDPQNADMSAEVLNERLLYYGLGITKPSLPCYEDAFAVAERCIVIGDAPTALWDIGDSDCSHVSQIAAMYGAAAGTQHFRVNRSK